MTMKLLPSQRLCCSESDNMGEECKLFVRGRSINLVDPRGLCKAEFWLQAFWGEGGPMESGDATNFLNDDEWLYISITHTNMMQFPTHANTFV